MITGRRRRSAAFACAAAASIACAAAASQQLWIEPGSHGVLPALSLHENVYGQLGVLNNSGAIELKNHPFFTALGTNGRACVSCHQPAYAMSVAAAGLRERWRATHGKDPVFAALDGANCPDLVQTVEQSHSLLLERGLFRVMLPWPPRDTRGRAIQPEFRIEVVRDPTGCNTHREYGLTAKT